MTVRWTSAAVSNDEVFMLPPGSEGADGKSYEISLAWYHWYDERLRSPFVMSRWKKEEGHCTRRNQEIAKRGAIIEWLISRNAT